MITFHCCYRSEFTFHSTTVSADSEARVRELLAEHFPETRSDPSGWSLRPLQMGHPPLTPVPKL